MKKIISVFLACFFAGSVFAQVVGTLTVTNVESTPGTGMTLIDYEFTGPAGAYNISAKVDFDDGEGFLPIPGDDLSGDVTKVEPGIRSFTWDGMESFRGRYSDETVVEVTATQVCGDTYSVTFTYNGTEVTYGTVWRGGLCWLDRNLGASRVPESSTDYQGYGALFQWGRLDDGHQVVTWTGTTTGDGTPTTSTLSTEDDPGHSDFITTSTSLNDWRDGQNNALWQGEDGINNPCPPGWRVPTEGELEAEMNSWGAGNQNAAGAFASTLKWPVGGYRFSNGALLDVGSDGYVRSSSVSGTYSSYLTFNSGNAHRNSSYRVYGMSVRCVR
jgi:hypothetical protein